MSLKWKPSRSFLTFWGRGIASQLVLEFGALGACLSRSHIGGSDSSPAEGSIDEQESACDKLACQLLGYMVEGSNTWSPLMRRF